MDKDNEPARLNEICDRLARIQNSPIVQKPHRTIGLGIIWAVAWFIVVAVIIYGAIILVGASWIKFAH